MWKIAPFAVACTQAVYALANTKSGFKASMDIDVIEQAKDVYFDWIIQTVNSLEIPDFYDDSNHYLKGNHFYLNERTSDVTITTDVAKNALVLRCDQLSGKFVGDDFRYREWPFVATGHLEVDIDTIVIQFGISFGQTTLPDGRQVPSISSVDVYTDIDRWDVDIKIWGNIWSDFASAFEVFFVGTVVDLLNDTITETLNVTVPTLANGIVAKSDGYFPIPVKDGWTVDYLTETPF